MDTNKADFVFTTSEKPRKLTVDPDYHIPVIRWMPLQLEMLWDAYPHLTVVYGTRAEAEANKAAALRFVDNFLGLDHEILKADTACGEEDLKSKCLILFGRPETNAISHRFKEDFPLKFTGNEFDWNGTTYDQPTQGVAQIIENPLEKQGLVILFAGLSGEATQRICDKKEWQEELDGRFLIDFKASYVIFDKHKKLTAGDWEDRESQYVWYF